MKPLRTYANFIKLEHTLFSLPLLFAGAAFAEQGFPPLRTLALIFAAGAGARTVALVLNRVIDRHIDRQNPRTQERHLASGKMKLIEAYAIGIIGLVIYLWAAHALSDFCLKLSWVPLVAFTAYPYFKRITPWTHVGLGLVWSLVPLAGFFAVKPSFDGMGPVLILALFSVFWPAGFDIIYATLDEEFDKQAGVRSLPAHWGRKRALSVSAVFHFLAFVTLMVLYGVWLSGPLTVMLLAMIGVLLFLEQYFSAYVDFSFFLVNILIGVAVLVFVMTGIKGV